MNDVKFVLGFIALLVLATWALHKLAVQRQVQHYPTFCPMCGKPAKDIHSTPEHDRDMHTWHCLNCGHDLIVSVFRQP